MSAIYIYKVLVRSSGGPNPWCWEEKWFTAKNKKEADRQANEMHRRPDGSTTSPKIIKKKKFVAKKHGEELSFYWVNAPRGYCADYVCHQCGNYWGTGGCRDKFGDETGKDKFCHYKKSKFRDKP